MATDESGPWRQIDPATARRPVVDGVEQELLPTVYHARRLRVSWAGDEGLDGVLRALGSLLDGTGWGVEVLPVARTTASGAQATEQQPIDPRPIDPRPIDPRELVELLPDEVARDVVAVMQSTVELVRTADDAGPTPDPWDLLLDLRSIDESLGKLVDLDHLVLPASLVAAPYWASPYWASPYWASPYWASPYWASPYWASTGGAESPAADYGRPGLGARTPVHVAAADPFERRPRPTRDGQARRPVVAVVDSGLGTHPWFPAPAAPTVTLPDGTVLAVGGDNSDADPRPPDPLGGTLSPTQGHGTFVAGLVRQTATYAEIVPVPVIDKLGIAAETDLYEALLLLFVRHRLGRIDPKGPNGVVDVVSVSLGTYHQLVGGSTGPDLLPVLAALVADGVTIVAAMGNDATDRRFYPAAYADHPSMEDGLGGCALLAVGALNPAHRSIAMFSNEGDWRTHLRCGAAIVSTIPTDLQGSLQAAASVDPADGPPRSTIDVDDFAGGFAVWSGTSFATPVVAGEVAAHIADHGDHELSLDELTARRHAAIAEVPPTPRRSSS